MKKNNILIVFILICIVCSEISAGLIDSIAALNTKNATVAEGLPKKKNSTSKYDNLRNKNKEPLETALDAHSPVTYKLQDAVDKNVDANLLSEKALEAIGDAAMAEQLSEKPKTTSTTTAINKGDNSTTTSGEIPKCEN